jgi:hypothetical protein
MQALSPLAFILIVIAAMVNLIFRDWRINAVGLASQYLAAFILVTLSWPIGMSVVKLIAGWMATAVIALTCLRQMKTATQTESTASFLFRGLAGLLVILVIFILAPILHDSMFPQIELLIVQGGLMLLGLSLMQLGTTSDPYLTIISLLSFLTGFEVIHAALEISTLLAGLLVIVNLGLALVGVYFIVKDSPKIEMVSEEEQV